MAIDINGHALESANTVVREEHELVGGSRTRAIRITGLVRGAGNLAELIEMLDDIARAASTTLPFSVSLREGRRLFARRERFSREVNARALTGQFVLDLRADDTWEESEVLKETEWEIGFSGATLELENEGTAASMSLLSLVAEDVLVLPSVSDGVRTLTYEGTVPAGATLVIDSVRRRVLLDGVDVTPYTSGDFPQLEPGETTLEYTDDAGSSHIAVANVSFRDRWW